MTINALANGSFPPEGWLDGVYSPRIANVILNFWQSNADGRAALANLPSEYDAPENCFVYFKGAAATVRADNGAWAALEAGVNNCYDPTQNQWGYSLPLAAMIAEAYGNCYLIEMAIDDTGLDPLTDDVGPAVTWAPGDDELFTDFFTWHVLMGLQDLVDAGFRPRIWACLHFGGEKDCRVGTTTTNNFATNLPAFHAAIRSELGLADLSIVMFRPHTSYNEGTYPSARMATIRSVHDSVAGGDANTYVIDTDAYALVGGDNNHIGADGHLDGAADAFAIIETLTPKRWTPEA